MSITVLVNGNPVNILEGSLRLSDRTNQRRSYQFVIRDDAGTALYKKGQPVTFNDSVLGTVYSGFLNAPKANNLTPNTTNLWTCDTVDMLWLGDKRSSNSVYTNQYSGVIVGDQVQNILSNEGVWANLALDYNHLQNDWTAGGATLAGVQAASNAGGGNPGDGDLELALAGSTVTKSESTTSGFSSGTLTNVQAASNALTLSTMPTIKLTGTCSGNPSSNINYTIWTGNYTIATGDVLYYTMWIDGSSANQIAFVHGHCSNGGNTGGIVDEQFLTETDGRVKDFASNQWYFRTVGLDVLAGSTLTNVWAGLTGSTSGVDTAYFHSIKIINGLTTKLTIFNSSLNANSLTHLYGYSGVAMMTTTSYYPASGSRISPSTSLAPVGILQAGRISWDANVPAGTSLTVSTSVSGGATWTPQTNSSAIANLLAGADATSLTLQVKEELAITGNDPTITPSLSSLQCVIRPSYAATKSDVRYSKYTTSDFNAGTLSNLIASSDANLTLNGVWRNWQNGLYPNQTLYGGGSPSQQVEDGSLRLSCASISDVRSRFDFAGQWNVLDMVITVDIPTADNLTNCGLVYGTSNWGNSNDSYAYNASISGTQLLLAKGTNSSGAGGFTSLATFNFTATLTQGSRHTLRVQWNGTGSTMNGIPAHTHNIYMDGVLYITLVDASYTAVGYIGARLFNTSGSPQVGHFDNFAAVISFVNTTWLSPNYSLNSVGTCGNSLIIWNAIVPNPSAILVETSIDGQATWQTATNGSQIVGLTDSVNLAGKNLNVRVTFTESPGNETIFEGFTCWVMSHYSSSGTWTSPALPLTGVGRAGASLVNWNANTPTNTGLMVATSVDNGSSYQPISTPGSPIPNLTVAPSPWVDVFPIDDHTVYTSTFYGSGANGTWTWDTANKRLVGSGGTNALLQYGGASLYGSAIYGQSYYGADPHFTQQDMDVIGDFNWSDGGGLFTRMTDANHLYYVIVNDASASSNPNTLRLFKYISGTVTQLGTTQTISFTRGSYVRIKLDAQGSALTVSLNGNQLLSVTDSSITGAGVSGFLCGTKIQAYSLRVQPLGQQLASATYAATASGLSPIRYYRLDESSGTTVHDLGSQGQNGTINGGVTLNQPGLLSCDSDTAMSFNGTGYISLPTTGLPTGASPWSMGCWVKFATVPGAGHYPVAFGLGNGANGQNVALYFNGDAQQFSLGFQGLTDIFSSVPVVAGHSYFLAGTYNGTTGTFYCYDATTGTSDSNSHAEALNLTYGVALIGASAGPSNGFTGVIDEPDISSSALSASQVNSLYVAGALYRTVLTQLTLTSTDPTATPQVLDSSTFVSDGSVQAGNKISAADYRDTIVSSNIDNENKNSNGWWTILASKQLIFQPQLATPAPWCLQSVADPNAANIQVAGLSMENSGDLYRNRQKLKGVNSTQSYDKQFTGDGKATSWTLDYKVAANTTPTIKLNGVVQTIGVQGVDSGKAFYYTPGNTSIQQDASGTTLQDIDTLEVDYLGSTTVTVTRNNTGQFPGTISQAAYKLIDSTSGIVEQVLDVSQMSMDVSTAEQYGDQLLQRYGVIGRIFTFMTLMSGLAIGQQLPIFLPCFSANNVQTLITQVDLTEKMTAGGIQYWYNCSATEGAALDGWAKVLAGALD